VCVSVRVSLARARSVPTGLCCLPRLPAPHTSTVLHQARAALWIGPPAAAVLDRFEDRRVATPEHARPRPRGTSASGTLRMRLTRWRRRWGGRIAKPRPREVVPLDVMQSKAPPSYHSSTPRGPGSLGVFSQRCFIRTVGKSHAKHGSGSTDSVDILSFISECRSDQLSCAFCSIFRAEFAVGFRGQAQHPRGCILYQFQCTFWNLIPM